MTEPQRPDVGKTISSVGCALFLLPFAVILGAFVLVFVTGGHVLYGVTALLVGLVVWIGYKNRGRTVRLRRRP